jgi:hypothetical protein
MWQSARFPTEGRKRGTGRAKRQAENAQAGRRASAGRHFSISQKIYSVSSLQHAYNCLRVPKKRTHGTDNIEGKDVV